MFYFFPVKEEPYQYMCYDSLFYPNNEIKWFNIRCTQRNTSATTSPFFLHLPLHAALLILAMLEFYFPLKVFVAIKWTSHQEYQSKLFKQITSNLCFQILSYWLYVKTLFVQFKVLIYPLREFLTQFGFLLGLYQCKKCCQVLLINGI